MNEYVQQRLREVRGHERAPKIPKVRKHKQPAPNDPLDRATTNYIKRIRLHGPERANWFDVRDGFIEGWHAGQGDLLKTLRLSGPTKSLARILRTTAASFELDGFNRTAALLLEAANEVERK